MGSLTVRIDEKRYPRLLAKVAPRVIRTEEENDRALAVVESLMEKGECNLTPEYGELLDLLTNLIRDYEAGGTAPGEVQLERDGGVPIGTARTCSQGSMAGCRLQESGIGNPCG